MMDGGWSGKVKLSEVVWWNSIGLWIGGVHGMTWYGRKTEPWFRYNQAWLV